MKRIGILSDTHCTLIPQLFDFFKDVDELWHAGDIGNIETADALSNLCVPCMATSTILWCGCNIQRICFSTWRMSTST